MFQIQPTKQSPEHKNVRDFCYKNKIGPYKICKKINGEIILGNNGWTGEGDRILLKIEENGGINEVKKILEEKIGPEGEMWKFTGNYKLHVNPQIQVLNSRREEIIQFLESAGLLKRANGLC